jgi:hypothetical protein
LLFRRKKKIKKPLPRRIINAFIYFGAGLIVLILVLFAVSQTNTFREWLREKVITTVNESINGELFIEEIQGTIFTSLILNNTTLVQGEDTLLNSEKIEVRTSPLKMVFKIIHFRKIELTNAKISFLKDEIGALNISKLTEPSAEEVVQGTTVSDSKFTFKIHVADLSLNNVEFNLQTTENKNSNKIYDNFNLDDLSLKNLNLSVDAFADISGKEFWFNVRKLSARPNLRGFVLKNLSGNIQFKNDEISVSDFKLTTARSDILLTASAKEFPILGGGDIIIEETPIAVEMIANDFNFDDLTNFIPATDLLMGSIKTSVNAKGTLNDLTVKKLNVAFRNTNFNLRGNIKNIPAGDRMFLDVVFSETYFHPVDPNTLLRSIDIPVYADYGIIKIDSLSFKGNPLQFSTRMYVRTDRGNFDGLVKMNLFDKQMKYNIVLFTQNLDLNPVADIATNLNSHIVLKGEGTSPASMKNELHFTANWSEIENRKYQSLNLDATSADANINYSFGFESDTTSGKIAGGINFKDPENPFYNIDATLYKLNISDIIPGDETESDFNISISAEGNNFDPDSLELFAIISVDSSTIGDIKLDGRNLIVDIRKNHEGGRLVNLVSNLADITLSGNFSILDITSLIDAEATLISDYIDYTTTKINPIDEELSAVSKYEYSLPDQKVNIDYSIEFKDFELLSLFLGGVDLEIDGDINGKVTRTGESISIIVAMDVNYFKYLQEGKLYFISDMVLNTEILNDFSENFPDAFQSDIDLSVQKLFLTEKFEDIKLQLSIKHNKLALKFNGQLDNYLTTGLSGNIELKEKSINLLMDSLYIRYNKFDLWNKKLIDITYADEKIYFNKFHMTHLPGEIELSGLFSLTNAQNLTLKIDDIPGRDVSTDVFQIPKETTFDSKINLSVFWQGTAQSPLLNLSFNVDSVRIKNKNVGTLISSAAYQDRNLSFKIDFLDTLFNIKNPKLKVEGLLPVDLALQKTDKDTTDNEIHISLEASGLELITFGPIVPYVKNLNGKLIASINVSGTADSLNFSGNSTLDNLSFRANENNIKYEAYANLMLDNENITVNKLFLKNLDGTKNGGTIYANGKIAHENFKFGDITFYANGQLKVLGKETRAVNPTIYGDLTIAMKDETVYNRIGVKNTLNADLIIKKGADVTISPTRSAFSSSTDKFIYEFKEYATGINDEALIDSLILFSRLVSRQQKVGPSKPSNINLQLKIRVEDEAKMVFVISPEFQQNLTAYLGGDFEYSIVNDKPVATGELVLLDGSKLEFIKPFEASGSVKFFDEIDNPYLDITATYNDYYLPSDTLGLNNPEKEVQIKIRLIGPLQELDRNFIQQEGNISVYIRDNSVSDYQLDATKTTSDAMMFIIVGKFTDDATSQDRNVAASTATSFAGTVIGTILNESFGDFVRSVRFQQYGTETKFSLIGKYGRLRYEIGGTSQVFQDITRANLKFEIPPITSLRNLILRLERRDPLQGSSTYAEMITAFGVKYRFDF